MSSPPLTPLRQYIPSINTSPLQRHSLSRRSSSFSAPKSPDTRRSSFSNHRLSNASRYSTGADDVGTPLRSGGGRENGMGNLADELDFADEDWEEEEEDEEFGEEQTSSFTTDDAEHSQRREKEHGSAYSTPLGDQYLQEPTQTDGARDSGVDVAYSPSPSPSVIKFSNGPFRRPSKVHEAQRIPSAPRTHPKRIQEDIDDAFTYELEDAMAAIARLADPAGQHYADTMSRTISALQDLSTQTMLENQSHRLTTSMSSLSANLVQQTRLIASLSTSLISPFSGAASLEFLDVDELLLLLAELSQSLPLPDPRALQGLTRLDRETAELLQTLSSIVDSLQMGKQAATSASRHLRVTQTMVTELRHERERADESRFLLDKEGWESKLSNRWCATECKDVVSGFEQVCDDLRRGIEQSAAV